MKNQFESITAAVTAVATITSFGFTLYNRFNNARKERQNPIMVVRNPKPTQAVDDDLELFFGIANGN